MKEKENNGMTTAKVAKEIYSKKCPECDTIFTSEYKEQLKYNFDLHHQACKRKNKMKKQKQKEKKK